MLARARLRGPGWLLCLAACTAAPPPAAPAAPTAPEPWPAADARFAGDPRWLGGDAVYSVALDRERILWLFGDSFVGRDDSRDRRRARMVRNTLAVQRGRDPATAALAFHWRTAANGEPDAFFAADGARGYWPLHGHRVPGGPLLLFQTLVRDTPGVGLGFAIDGWRLVRIDDPDAEPTRWRADVVPVAAAPADVTFGTAVWFEGEHLVVLGTRGNGPHRGVLARMLLRDADAASPRFEGWLGDRWAPLTADSVLAEVLDEAGPECSVHAAGDGFVHVWSRGFGATTIAVHTAATPRGPWSSARDVFTPPDAKAPRPFVYAGKAHPDLDAGAGWLAVSYAANAFDFGELFTAAGQRQLYWPRFWRVPAAGLTAPPRPRH